MSIITEGKPAHLILILAHYASPSGRNAPFESLRLGPLLAI